MLHHSFQNLAFDIFMTIFVVTYVVATFGVSLMAPRYMYVLDACIKVYIGAFLMWRFSPYRKVAFTDLDAKIAYNAGSITLASTVVSVFGQQYWWVTAVLTLVPMIVEYVMPP